MNQSTLTPVAATGLAPLPAALARAPEFLEREREQLVRNCETVQREGLTPAIARKLESFAERFGLAYELVRHKFLTDDLFAYTFGTAPGRQTLHETLARDYLARLPLFHGFAKPPAAGAESLLITPQGTVATKRSLGSGAATSRSIDFTWRLDVRPEGGITQTLMAYASHKYTAGQGGAQDKQRAELEAFLLNASYQRLSGDTVFFAIADGDHYERHWPALASAARGPQAVPATTATLPRLWAEQVRLWLARRRYAPDERLAQALVLLEGP